MWALLPRTVTLCIHLDVGFIAHNFYTVSTFRCGLYFLKLLQCVYNQVGLYCPEPLHCVYI